MPKFCIFGHHVARKWSKSGPKWHLDACYRSESYWKRFLVQKNIGIDTKIEPVRQLYEFHFCPHVATMWHKSGSKWHLDAFYRSESYWKRFLVPKNIGIDTNIEPVRQL
jgi:hypothetical protein